MKLWQDKTVITALIRILEDYPYLEYDEAETKFSTKTGADSLRIKVTDSRDIGHSVGHRIASELSKATGRKFTHPNPENNPNPQSQRKYLTIRDFSRSDLEGSPTQKGSQ